MGLFRMIAVAGIVGIGAVTLSQHGLDQTAGDVANGLRSAGQQAGAARDFCTSRPDLCATVAAGAADLARQEVARRIRDGERPSSEITGRIAAPPERSTLPPQPPLPPRRPAAFP